MGRMFKKILVGAGFALILFLITVFFFGERQTIAIPFASGEKFAINTPALLSPQYNLTEALGAQIIENIIAKNPDGPVMDEVPLISLDVEETVQKTLKTELETFNPDDLWPIYEETKLPVIRPATAEAQKAYLLALQSVFAALSQSRVNQNDLKTTDFGAMAKAREIAFSELYKTPVPEDLLDIHLELLDLLGAQKNIYVILSNYQEDPLKALLALEFQQELLTIGESTQTALINYLEKNNLTL